MQLTHYTSNFKKQKFPIILVSDNVTNAPNIGSLFRISDAFGIEKLILCGEHIPLGRKMTKTSRATEKAVSYQIETSAFTVAKALKENGYQIIALEITSNSIPVHEHIFSKEKPIAVFVGDENFGVSEDILQLSHQIVHINMFGQNSSMNVVQATNIALYEITKQFI
ncbi:TrmH family RNA methyltransferase [Jejuia pallidilutea]|uniref:tRNA/rRNA methyltransferase n=1 Tax=Jejuia pallidilutea TaxID=504487 RepID=A0A090WTD5_9FLAO|nr:TrmH family RNA methyltransferase [Jejuia pallidilutea]GAL66967.1 tRNA/rRNA methyltransferase [Jejuia pallidilutea]GAL70672.1 tRNA/rRNA methyltransferase [Jejuia pallidilutea]GAL90551.1 tRNA/rRNA methyltransferase [Jejuia pallidilutea]